MDSARRLTAEHLRLALNTVGPPYKVALAGHIAALEQRIDELERKGSCDAHCVTQYRKVLDYAVATRMMLGGSNQHSAADRVLSRLASLESQLSGAVAEQERLREALLGKRLAHELTDLMARLLHYQNGDEPRWADMPYEAFRKEWDELPEPIVSRYRNDFKFNAQVSRAVARIRDTICAALRPAEASHD